MRGDITVVAVEPSPLAVVRLSTTFSEWPGQVIKTLGIVYEAVRAKKIKQSGQNVMVYHPPGGQRVDVECGVKVAAKFETVGEIAYCETPGGTAATMVHLGAYDQLVASHRAVVEWGRKNGHRFAGVCWGIYGDWNEDLAKLRTDIFHLLEGAEYS